jgi:hypothetical protein
MVIQLMDRGKIYLCRLSRLQFKPHGFPGYRILRLPFSRALRSLQLAVWLVVKAVMIYDTRTLFPDIYGAEMFYFVDLLSGQFQVIMNYDKSHVHPST